MKINSAEFRVREGDKVNLHKWPTQVEPFYKSKQQYRKLLRAHVAQLSAQQQLLYASNRYAILLIFQAMDAAGKDGAIKHVMSGVNPQGCQVFSFKHPSAAELEHDFLWRTNIALPARGQERGDGLGVGRDVDALVRVAGDVPGGGRQAHQRVRRVLADH